MKRNYVYARRRSNSGTGSGVHILLECGTTSLCGLSDGVDPNNATFSYLWETVEHGFSDCCVGCLIALVVLIEQDTDKRIERLENSQDRAGLGYRGKP
jgi:hypothetical protein